VWIEVEGPGLTTSDVVVRLNGTNQALTSTVLGVIAVIPASSSTQSYSVGVTIPGDPDIAVTMINSSNVVLYSTQFRETLPDYRPLVRAVTTPAASGPLAFSGLPEWTQWLLIAGLGAAVIGAALALTHRRRAPR